MNLSDNLQQLLPAEVRGLGEDGWQPAVGEAAAQLGPAAVPVRDEAGHRGAGRVQSPAIYTTQVAGKLKNYYFKNVVNNLLCRGFVPCVNVTIFDTLKTVAPAGVDVSF